MASLIDCMVLSYSVLISVKQCRTRSFPGDILHDMQNTIFGFNQGGSERGYGVKSTSTRFLLMAFDCYCIFPDMTNRT